jgi:MSHA biogenesis protein MshQ
MGKGDRAMRICLKWLFFICSLLVSPLVLADSYLSCDVSSERDFSVQFTIDDNEDDLYISTPSLFGNDRLWSAESRLSTIIYDGAIQEDENYYLALSYADSGNRLTSGVITYYKSNDGNIWNEIQKENVNFYSLFGNNMKVWAEADEDITSLSCSDSQFIPSPEINRDPQFEFGRLSASECPIDSKGNVNCTLTFKNTYEADQPVPLVFVMSTIESENTNKSQLITELPSSLRVSNVTHQGANVVQLVAPHEKSAHGVKFKQAPMQDIDYFVMEPGVLELSNGSKIVANSLFTSRTISKGDKENNTGEIIDFSQYGLSSDFTSVPGVLVEPQTKNNTTAWFTGYAGAVGKKQFRLALERSEVTSNNSVDNNEKVAFVAGQGAGFVNGKKFWLGQAETTNTTKNETDKIFNPVIKGCKLAYTDISEGNFDSPPILVATKNSRNGGNGGWLRRCDLQKDKVSFIVEEDMNKDSERAHAAEKAGFFMFEEPKDSPVCNLFPSPAQTWTGNQLAHLSIQNNAQIIGAPLVAGERFVGFLANDIDDNKNNGCDGVECKSESGLMIDKITLESFRPPLGGFENIIISSHDEVVYNSDEQIGALTVNKSGKAIFKSGTYWIDNINVLGDIEIPSGHEVLIHTKGFALSNEAFFGSLGQGQLVVAVHDLTYSYNPTSIHDWVDLANNSNFKGLLYSEKNVEISNHAILTGAVTASIVNLHPNSKIIGSNQCFDPPKDYTLKVTPKIDYSLTCERIPVKFTVEDDNGPVSGFNKYFSAVINAKDNGAACWSTSADKSVAADCAITGSTFVDGEKTLYLDSADLDVFDVTASSENLNETEQEHFEFVPFKFEVDTVQVIANKSQSFDINVLACNDGTPDVVQDYNGSKTLEVSSYTLDSPNPIEGVRTDLELESKVNPSQIDLTFRQGIATTSLTYQEAGSVHFKLSDPSFTCPSGFDCNDYPVDSGLLSAAVKIESRPWKLAVCSDVAVDGNSSGGSAFVAAGEAFSLKVKPVRYGSSSECDLPITENFFKSSAPQALISALTPTLDSPLSSTGGTLGTLSPLLSFTNNTYAGSNSTSHYLFENMTYDEVGSIQFNVEAVSNGFYDSIQNGIDNGNKAIGRFYPAYFTITGTEWDYPAEQGSSDGTTVYMGQGFDTEFEVVSYSRGGELTTNYGLFSSNLKADFVLTGTYSNRLNISSGDLDDTNWSGAVWTTPDFLNGVIWSRKSASALAGNITTQEDGPFNMSGNSNSVTTTLGLKISGVDPVSFDSTSFSPAVADQELLSQPDVRYGRMVLDSVGTAVGQDVKVPLRVEYWNGNTFVLSDTDGASKFDGEQHCKQTVWPDPTQSSSTILKGSNTVVQGSDTTNLVADANNSTLREQVRFWLRLASSSPQISEMNVDCESGHVDQPWLQYNWRGQGDEDPSTVVTFGIYRGNDRVIFRGESNIIGTSN